MTFSRRNKLLRQLSFTLNVEVEFILWHIIKPFESKFKASNGDNKYRVPDERLPDAILNESAKNRTVNIARPITYVL